MGSFAVFALPWYVLGFITLAFWRRWRVLLAVGALAAVLSWKGLHAALADGSVGAFLDVAVAFFLALGAGAGFVSSTSAIILQGKRWFRPSAGMLAFFAVGYGGYFAYVNVDEVLRQARLVPPSQACLHGRHPATLGGLPLSLPVAPGLFAESADASGGHYLFDKAAYSLAREFCSDAENSPPKLTSVSLDLDRDETRGSLGGVHPFCTGPHPEFPWAYLACHPLPVSEVGDMPTMVRASPVRADVDIIASERLQMSSLPVIGRANGVETRGAGRTMYMARDDGYFARCGRPGTARQPYLQCSAYVRRGGMLLWYRFRTTDGKFARHSAVVEANAIAAVTSLIQ